MSLWEEYADEGPKTHSLTFQHNPWAGGPQLQAQALLPRSSARQTTSNKQSYPMDPSFEFMDEDWLRQRDEAIAEIEQEMRALQPLWVEVADLVEQQGERVESIQTAIETSLGHVQKAKDEVAEANRSQINSRKNTAIAAGAGAGIGAAIIGIITLKFLIH